MVDNYYLFIIHFFSQQFILDRRSFNNQRFSTIPIAQLEFEITAFSTSVEKILYFVEDGRL